MSISSEATFPTGMSDKRSFCSQLLDWSNDFSLLLAAFESAIWLFAEDGLVMFLIDSPSSFKTLLDSTLISEHTSSIVHLISDDPCKGCNIGTSVNIARGIALS